MDPLTLLVFLAALGTIAALASGIAAMAWDGEVGHKNSVQWMTWRVGCQAAAFLIILLALLASN